MDTISSIMLREHNNILIVIDAMENNLKLLEEGESIDKEFYGDVLFFLREYADGVHHHKEEDVLFYTLKMDESIKTNKEIDRLMHQHILSRAYFNEIEKAFLNNNISRLTVCVKEYIRMIRDHIHEEDTVLFPLLEDFLTDKVKEIIVHKFKSLDSKKDFQPYVAVIKKIKERA